MLICWMDGFDQNERSICTCTFAYKARLSPSHSKQKKQKKVRGRSRVDSERCLHVRTAFTFTTSTTSCCLTKAKSNYRITRQRRWLVLCALCFDPMLCTWCSRYAYWFDVCMFARLCIYLLVGIPYTCEQYTHKQTRHAYTYQEKTATMWFDVLTNNEEVGSPILLFIVVVAAAAAYCCRNEGRCV